MRAVTSATLQGEVVRPGSAALLAGGRSPPDQPERRDEDAPEHGRVADQVPAQDADRDRGHGDQQGRADRDGAGKGEAGSTQHDQAQGGRRSRDEGGPGGEGRVGAPAVEAADGVRDGRRAADDRDRVGDGVGGEGDRLDGGAGDVRTADDQQPPLQLAVRRDAEQDEDERDRHPPPTELVQPPAAVLHGTEERRR